jgi:hypothetical protein
MHASLCIPRSIDYSGHQDINTKKDPTLSSEGRGNSESHASMHSHRLTTSITTDTTTYSPPNHTRHGWVKHTPSNTSLGPDFEKSHRKQQAMHLFKETKFKFYDEEREIERETSEPSDFHVSVEYLGQRRPVLLPNSGGRLPRRLRELLHAAPHNLVAAVVPVESAGTHEQ